MNNPNITDRMNKCFLRNPEKKVWLIFVLSFSKKTQKTLTLITKNDVTEPVCFCFRFSETWNWIFTC